jgi:hypothetical protein
VKKAVFLILFSAACLYLPLGMKRATCGFRLQKIECSMPFSSDWEAAPPTPAVQLQLQRILDQPFSYLDKGMQSYVFKSEDDLYVIKFFRFDESFNPIRRFIRTQVRKRALHPHALKRISHLFAACKLAYTLAPEETEVLYLHLNCTKDKLPSLLLKGPLGRSFSLPLDSYRFVIQKKALPLEKTLLLAKQTAQMEPYLDALLSLLSQRSSKGIINCDRNLFRNFGFIGQKAIEIDFGNYRYSSDVRAPDLRTKEIRRFTASLRVWLESYAPEWVAYLDEKLRDQNAI